MRKARRKKISYFSIRTSRRISIASLILFVMLGAFFFYWSSDFLLSAVDGETRHPTSYSVPTQDINLSWVLTNPFPLEYLSHDFFGESLHLQVDSDETISTYQFIQEGITVLDEIYNPESNQAIQLQDLYPGEYYLTLNYQPVTIQNIPDEPWYTIGRNGTHHRVILSHYKGYLKIQVTSIEVLPENVYDLIVDAGHGGLDGGASANGLTEAVETLKVSQYLSKRFEEHGLKVKLTRETDEDPAQQSSFNYLTSPYEQNGRVSQVYEYKANYVISNHLNAYDSSLKGTEIYGSVHTTLDWESNIATELTEIHRLLRDSIRSEYRVGEGVYKKYLPCNETLCSKKIDYLYMIRETSGKRGTTNELLRYSTLFSSTPSHGAETILIEYAYLDSIEDAKRWEEHWQQWAEAVVKGTCDYLSIPYHSPY